MRTRARRAGIGNRPLHSALALCSAALALLPSAASADLIFGPEGSGAGQTKNPAALAVDESNGTVYVADTGNNRIDVFDEGGQFLRAFGWDVIPPGQPGDTGAGLETCTAASTCKAGVSGSGAGQLGVGNQTIAVDNDPLSPSFHSVYVVDSGNSRVQRFTPTGEFVLTFGGGVNKTTGADLCTAASGDTCGAGADGKGTGEFSGGGAFIGVGVGPGGLIYVADSPRKGSSESEGFDNRAQLFEADGLFVKECSLPQNSSGPITALAADQATGEFYVATRNAATGIFPAAAAVRKYGANCAFLMIAHDSREVRGALAVDDEGNVFVGDPFPNDPEDLKGDTAVYEYDSAGAPVRTFYGNGTLKARPASLAPYSNASGDVFVIESSSPRRLAHISFPDPGPVVVPETTKAPNPRSARATLEARVNPEGKATTFHFEYLTEADYVANGSSFSGPNPPTSTPESTSIGSDFKARLAKAEVKGLAPETDYRFRVVATNEDAPADVIGEEVSFTTLDPIEVLASWSSQVSATAARLHAEVNPLGTAATGFFEYLDQQSFEEQGGFAGPKTQITPELDFGAGEEPVVRSAQLGSLEPNTIYRYRFSAQSHCKPDPEVVCDFPDQERSFVTFPLPGGGKGCPNEAFRVGPAANLPDCRAYEMVSPLDKANGDIAWLNELTLIGLLNPKTLVNNSKAHVNQATPEGDALTYSSYRAFGDAISTPYSSQYIAERDPESGWSSHSLNPPLEVPSLYLGAYLESLYKGFSEDLCHGYMVQDTDIALAEGAPSGVPNLYRRHSCGEDRFELLTTVAPTEPAPGFSKETEEESLYFPTVQGFSSDGSAAAFKAPAKLTPEGSEEDIYQVYLHKDGELHLVSVLPDGVAADTHASVGTALGIIYSAGKRLFDSVDSAVSANGSRVFWSAEADEPSSPVHGGGSGISLGPSILYLRLNATEEQSAVASTNGLGKLEAGSKTVTSLVAARGKASITSGSPIATITEMTFGEFFVGQPISGPGIPGGTTILEVSGNTLTLSNNASATNASATLSSSGPAPFAVGQQISGPGIPPKTAITEVAPGSLTLSRAATESKANASLSAAIGCSEPDKACTLQLSYGPAMFIAADPQADKALFREGEDLYEYDVAKAIAHEAGARTLIAKEVPGVVGTSEDLSRVYFPSRQVCSGEATNSEGDKAQAGKANLYLYEAGEECGAGELAFVGTFGVGDAWSWEPMPVDRMARVSDDGLHAAFVSRTPLTGYDSTDPESGELSAEVFLYDAGEAQLRCISCNPSGGRPEAARNLTGEPRPPYFVAAKIPGWETQWHPSRVLSEDGSRLFFESFEALLLRDTNGKQDVYEWQQAESGKECEEAGAELFVPSAGGCISLISSGTSAELSEFIDASANGRDVFFTTASSLVPQDYGLIDVYDARINGGFPSEEEEEPECEGEACQSPPLPPAQQTPASSAFKGAGNLPPPGPRKPLCGKRKQRVVRNGKARCVKKPKRARANKKKRRASR